MRLYKKSHRNLFKEKVYWKSYPTQQHGHKTEYDVPIGTFA